MTNAIPGPEGYSMRGELKHGISLRKRELNRKVCHTGPDPEAQLVQADQSDAQDGRFQLRYPTPQGKSSVGLFEVVCTYPQSGWLRTQPKRRNVELAPLIR